MLNFLDHSVYTYKNSISYVKDLAIANKEKGWRSFAISDRSPISFIKAINAAKENDILFVPGCDLLTLPTYEYSVAFAEKELSSLGRSVKKVKGDELREIEEKIAKLSNSLELNHFVYTHNIQLYGITNKGFENFIRLFNRQKEIVINKKVGEVLCLDFETILKEICDSGETNKLSDMLCIAGINSPLSFYIKRGSLTQAKEFAEMCKTAFGKNFYIQVQPYWTEEEKEVNMSLLNFAKENNIPVIFSNPTYYINKDQIKLQRLYYHVSSVIMNKSESIFHDDCGEENYVLGEANFVEYAKRFYEDVDVDTFISNLHTIDSSIQPIEFPKASPLPDGSEELRKRCEEGFKKFYTDRFERGEITKEELDEARERLEYELDVINSKNFASYFLKVKAITDTAYEMNILHGPGRGSACGSLACYLCEITRVNPLKYGLFFERFINPGRNSFPDVDVDFATEPCR